VETLAIISSLGNFTQLPIDKDQSMGDFRVFILVSGPARSQFNRLYNSPFRYSRFDGILQLSNPQGRYFSDHVI
jgi:hypothetical protein